MSERETIRLVCRETAGLAREGEPVTIGVPFPRGRWHDPERLGLTTADGKAVPLQTRVTVRWDDGSVRWLLADFLADVPANGQATYSLREGDGSAPRDGATVPGPDGTGMLLGGGLRWAVHDRAAEGLLSITAAVDQSLTAAQLGLTVTDAAGTRYRATGDSTAGEAEAPGPLRAAALLFGPLVPTTVDQTTRQSRGLAWRLRLQGTARPELRGELTLMNQGAEPVALDAVQVVATLPGTPLRLACSGPSSGRTTGLDLDAPRDVGVTVVQRGPVAWGEPIPFTLTTTADAGTEVRADGATGSATRSGSQARADDVRLDGAWCAADTAEGRAVLAIRRCAAMHPKGLAAESRAGTARLVASMLPPGQGGLTLTPGNAASMDFLLRLAPAEQPEAGGPRDLGTMAETTARAFAAPLYACADPAWACATGALGDLVPADAARFPRYEWLTGNGLASLEAVRERRHEYGQRDYGDWAYDRYPRGWGNVEYDLPHACFLLYARSGEPRFWDWAIDTVRHYRDVDVNHGGDERLDAGAPYIHHTEHTGRGNDLGHTWLEGLLDWYYLTGDPAALETARGIADFCLAAVKRTAFARRSERAIGWMLICLTEYYRATRDARFLDGCQPVVGQALEWQDKERGHWPNPIGECDRDPKCSGGKPFMVGIVLEGLRRYHELSGDARVGEAIVRAARWLVTDGVWIEADRGFVYATCHLFAGKGRTGEIRELDGLLYAYQLSGERRFLDVAVAAWDAALQPVGQPYDLDGKGYAILTRSTPHVLARLAKALPDRRW